MQNPTALLEHHLKQLKLPTMIRDYQATADACAEKGKSRLTFPLRMAECELRERKQRAAELRLEATQPPVLKTQGIFDFEAQPSTPDLGRGRGFGLSLDASRHPWYDFNSTVLRNLKGIKHMAYVTVETLFGVRDRVCELLSKRIALSKHIRSCLHASKGYSAKQLNDLTDDIYDRSEVLRAQAEKLRDEFPDPVRTALEVGRLDNKDLPYDCDEELSDAGVTTYTELALMYHLPSELSWLTYSWPRLEKAGYRKREVYDIDGEGPPTEYLQPRSFVESECGRAIDIDKTLVKMVREEFAYAARILPALNSSSSRPASHARAEVSSGPSEGRPGEPGGDGGDKPVTTRAGMARLLLEVHGAPPVNTRSSKFKRAEKRVRDAVTRGDIELPCDEQAARDWARKQEFRIPLSKAEDDFDFDID